MQSSVDQDINFDEKSIDLIKRKSDSNGEVNYMRVISDMVIRSTIAFTGTIKLQWHLGQALDTHQLQDKNAMLVYHNDKGTDFSETNSRASTLYSTQKPHSSSSQVLVAKKKILIKKNYGANDQGKLINLNSVSAMCPVLNLRKNQQQGIYLKANQMSMKSLNNKARI